jgi:predicted DNA-binding antitoxin AbrB/MazE fold protein
MHRKEGERVEILIDELEKKRDLMKCLDKHVKDTLKWRNNMRWYELGYSDTVL